MDAPVIARDGSSWPTVQAWVLHEIAVLQGTLEYTPAEMVGRIAEAQGGIKALRKLLRAAEPPEEEPPTSKSVY